MGALFFGRTSTRRLVALAAGNINRNWRASILLLVLMVGSSAGGIALGPGSLHSYLVSEAARRDTGSNIVVARSEVGMAPGRCDSLNTASGVVSAGWIRSTGQATVRPGIYATTGGASPGFIQLLGTSTTDTSLVGGALADRLAASDGATLRVIKDRGIRTEQFTSWYLIVDSGVSEVEECWAEFSDNAFPSAIDIFVAAFALESPDLEVSTLMFDAGPQPFNRSAFYLAGILSGAFIGVAGGLVIRARRIDLALYRLLGWTRRQAAIILGTEVTLLIGAAITIATSGWLVGVGAEAVLPRAVLASLVFTIAVQLLVASAVVWAVAFVAVRSSNLLSILRSGA